MSQRNTQYDFTGKPSESQIGFRGYSTGWTPGEHDEISRKDLVQKPKITQTPQLEAREKLYVNGKEFVSVKGQKKRFYDVPTGKGGSTVRVVINKPEWLFVRESGAHEVIDADKVVHYIRDSWVHLAWENEEGEPLSRF